MNRYFEVLFNAHGKFDMLAEYGHEWGHSAWNDATYKFGYTTRDRHNWFIYSENKMTLTIKQEILERISDGDILWEHFDMSKADNPKSQRQPAMSRRRKK